MITITSSLYNCHDLTTYSFLLEVSTYLLCLVMLMTTAGLPHCNASRLVPNSWTTFSHTLVSTGLSRLVQTHGPPSHSCSFSAFRLIWFLQTVDTTKRMMWLWPNIVLYPRDGASTRVFLYRRLRHLSTRWNIHPYHRYRSTIPIMATIRASTSLAFHTTQSLHI